MPMQTLLNVSERLGIDDFKRGKAFMGSIFLEERTMK